MWQKIRIGISILCSQKWVSSITDQSGMQEMGVNPGDFDDDEGGGLRSWEPSDKADLHFVYKDVEGASTQLNVIQRKLGNLPPKPSAFKPDPFTPADDEDSKPKTESRIVNKT
ncbi:unnamed protein product [Lactuca saligna]|uniref:Uncharacterized protein n=1 Tax=Lactuca saligna TaxID=75948 RepID=A0AA35Y289_LACSI|nr:unnamed protein product [Lactuca saligna]